MGTEAQQALQRSSGRTRAGGANQRNQAGTRKAQALARRNTGIDSSGSGMQKSDSALGPSNRSYDPTERAMDKLENTEVGPGTGGYGPTTGGDKALRKTNERADPGLLIRDTIGAMNGPKVVRAPGSIWDDPEYANMANEHGSEFAIRARNLGRQIKQAQQLAQIRKQTQADQLAIDEGKLYDKQLQQAMRSYAPAGTTTGFENVTGTEAPRTSSLAVDETGAFTGEGKQAAMTGPGPTSDAEVAAQQRQHEIRKEALSSLGDLIEGLSGIDQYDISKEQRPLLNQKIQALSQTYQQLLGAGEQPGGKQGKDYVTDPNTGKKYRVGDKLPNGMVISRIWSDHAVEVQ